MIDKKSLSGQIHAAIDFSNHIFVGTRNAQFTITYLVPTIGHQYTSPVGSKVISGFGPEAAANTSLSLNNWCGVNPVLNVICTSSQMGFIPSPGIASITLIKG